MRLLGIRSFLSRSNVSKAWRSSKIHRGSTEAVSRILSRWSSGNHVATPPMFDSKVGFNDYEKERREFRLDVPEYFNFAKVLDEWAQKEKVGTYVLHEMRTNYQIRRRLYLPVHKMLIGHIIFHTFNPG